MGQDFFSRLRRHNKSKEDVGKPLNPAKYMLAGLEVTCTHCKNNKFIEGTAQVNTTVKSAMLGLDYKKVYTLICSECGFLHWMMQEPHRMLDESIFD